ncbi:phytanoyl-CoA dioxygenase family protein [Paenibacillus elgii]|uniref:phytanoyl-CoA dioxygenase family protein n=1 Tax=Paenibacillus elgii TaxID=189691 RepID=UPI002D7D536C|nr:phytanoyl-CoA dioxygenase family protein [Paenibacillus elgii]
MSNGTVKMPNDLYSYEKQAVVLENPLEINDKHLNFYKQNGYLAVNNVLGSDSVKQAKEALMDIIYGKYEGPKIQFLTKENSNWTPEERELHIRKMYNFIDYVPVLRDIVYSPEIVNIVEGILGEESRLTDPISLLKSPKVGPEKPWHQDMAYGVTAYDKPLVGAWVALDEARAENGCMHIIPRSHLQGAVPHYSIRDWQVCDEIIQVDKDEYVPLKPGGVLFFHGLLIHGTPENNSNLRRRSLQLHFLAKTANKLSSAEYKRMFTNELTGAEC